MDIYHRLYPDERAHEQARSNARKAETIRGSGDWDDMGLREQADDLYDKQVGDTGPSYAWEMLNNEADEKIPQWESNAIARGDPANAAYARKMLPTFKNQWGKRIMGPSVPGLAPHPRGPMER
jgi:hypothetical protein